MLRLAVAGLIFGSILSWGYPKNKPGVIKVEGIGIISVLNAGNKKIDIEALTDVIKKICYFVDAGQLERSLVEIDENHTIVKEALASECVKVESRPSGKHWNMLIPTMYKGNRIILFKQEDQETLYQLHGLPRMEPRIDFSSCIN